MRHLVTALLAAMAAMVAAAQTPGPALAIVGATIVDGNGGPPLSDGTVVIDGGRITAVGARTAVTVPPGAETIDGRGKFVVPGFVDTNVHLSLYGGANDRYETLVRYFDRQPDI